MEGVAAALLLGLVDRLETIPIAIFARHDVARDLGDLAGIGHRTDVGSRLARRADLSVVAVCLAFTSLDGLVDVEVARNAVTDHALAFAAGALSLADRWAGLVGVAIVGAAVTVIVDAIAGLELAGVDAARSIVAVSRLGGGVLTGGFA